MYKLLQYNLCTFKLDDTSDSVPYFHSIHTILQHIRRWVHTPVIALDGIFHWFLETSKKKKNAQFGLYSSSPGTCDTYLYFSDYFSMDLVWLWKPCCVCDSAVSKHSHWMRNNLALYDWSLMPCHDCAVCHVFSHSALLSTYHFKACSSY
jgi:hypothetical protein